MLHSSYSGESAYPLSPNDELGQLIRWSLQRSFGAAEPSPEVWANILRRVEEEGAQASARRRGGPLVRTLAPVVQAVVVSTLLLTLVFGVNPDIVLPRQAHRSRAAPAKRAALVLEAYPADSLRGYVLMRIEQDQFMSTMGNIPRFAELR